MTNTGDAAEQVVRLSLEGFEVAARLTGSAAKNIAILLASVLKQEATQANKTRGKARLTNMIKSGKELKVFSIPNKDLKKFTEQAKRYGVLYCVLRDKNTKGDNVPIDIITRAEDASKIQRIVEKFELGKVDKVAIVTGSQKAVEKREALEKDKPTKTKNEIITDEATRKPIQKEENSQSNPTVAKTDKNPPSRQDSEPADMRTDKGAVSEGQKPSVKEKLDHYRAKSKQQKEAERKEPKVDKEKTNQKPNQTVHTQPKPKSKKPKERYIMTNNFKPAKTGQQNNRLSREEYAEKMRKEKEAVYQMADETATEIVASPEKFKAFLDTQSRLDRYSAVNALLIFKQRPDASQLKNFDDWSKENVKIQKGAKSVSILEPVEYAKRDGTIGISYNVKKVFDISQTNGKKPPALSVNRDPKALITTMLDSSPVNVEATDELPYPNMAAFYNNEEQTLYVKRDVGDSVAVAQCVAQELGHAQLSINSESYSRADMGFQAVCIGYMLCKKYGVDTQNFAINRIPDNLSSKEPKDIRFELSKTRNAMADIHSRISDELYKKKQERSKGYER